MHVALVVRIGGEAIASEAALEQLTSFASSHPHLPLSFTLDMEAARVAAQRSDLIEALRSIRRYGAVRFIVNPYGLVLTKRPPAGRWSAEELWEPVFVGKINLDLWFEKEG